MLEALCNGVKGGQWFSLIDKIYSLKSLRTAFTKVKRNKGAAGIDRIGIEQFELNLEENLQKLSEQLREGRYQPQEIRRVYIEKPGSKEKRPLGIPTVRDRVVQTALRQVIEPIFEKEFAPNSYGFRPGRGCKDALREVDKKLREGKLYVVDADIKSYFDRIPHEKLMKKVEERVADSRVLELIRSFLKQGVMEEGECFEPEEGTPQGAVISPLLANIYLNSLDHLMKQAGVCMIRYADDLVILCETEEEALTAHTMLKTELEQRDLELNAEKTHVVNMGIIGASFSFLGYEFRRKKDGSSIQRWPRKKSLQKLKDEVRALTRRSNWNSLENIIYRLNPRLKGWFNYFKHCHWRTFEGLDGWIRGRLRSILRKWSKRTGRGRGQDHLRWPNTFFADAKLFSLLKAWQQSLQSARR